MEFSELSEANDGQSDQSKDGITEELFHPVTGQIQQLRDPEEQINQNLKDRIEMSLYSEIPFMISRLKELDRKITIDINVRIEEDRTASKLKRTGEVQRVYHDRKFTQQLQELMERAASLHREIHKTTDGTDQKDDTTGKTIAMKVQNIEEDFEALTQKNLQMFSTNQAELIDNQFTYLDEVEIMLRDPVLTDYKTIGNPLKDITLKPWKQATAIFNVVTEEMRKIANFCLILDVE